MKVLQSFVEGGSGGYRQGLRRKKFFLKYMQQKNVEKDPFGRILSLESLTYRQSPFCLAPTIFELKKNENMKQLMSHCILVAVFFVSIFPIIANGEMYSYVDENGKTQYTNVVPPRNAKSVKTDKEITVNKTTVEERLEQKQIETEDLYEWKKKQQREAAKIAAKRKEEQNRIDLRNKAEKKEHNRKIRKEKKYILSKEKSWLSKCDDMKTGFLIVQKCRDRVKKRTKQDLRLLRKSTGSYFIHKYSNRGDTDRYFEKMYDSLLEKY